MTIAEPIPLKARPTVTPDGVSVEPRIQGVVVHYRAPVEDERGELVEIYNPAWGLDDAPLVYCYHSTIRSRRLKGWVVHKLQDDRLFLVQGIIRIALFDNRADSPTYRMLNKFVISERHRALVIVPRGVYHAVQNIGRGDATFVNLPTRAYNHADPDKYVLPVKNDLIPFAFDDDDSYE